MKRRGEIKTVVPTGGRHCDGSVVQDVVSAIIGKLRPTGWRRAATLAALVQEAVSARGGLSDQRATTMPFSGKGSSCGDMSGGSIVVRWIQEGMGKRD